MPVGALRSVSRPHCSHDGFIATTSSHPEPPASFRSARLIYNNEECSPSLDSYARQQPCVLIPDMKRVSVAGACVRRQYTMKDLMATILIMKRLLRQGRDFHHISRADEGCHHQAQIHVRQPFLENNESHPLLPPDEQYSQKRESVPRSNEFYHLLTRLLLGW